MKSAEKYVVNGNSAKAGARKIYWKEPVEMTVK